MTTRLLPSDDESTPKNRTRAAEKVAYLVIRMVNRQIHFAHLNLVSTSLSHWIVTEYSVEL